VTAHPSMIGIMWLRERSREPRAMYWAAENNVMNEASGGRVQSAGRITCEYAMHHRISARFRAMNVTRAMCERRFQPATLTFP
jgi:hypothetical protein